MESMTVHTLFTIGYSGLTLGQITELLRRHCIGAVADVRSQPYSKFAPEFTYDHLKRVLPEKHIQYVFLGEELGARRKEPECYEGGRVVYEQVVKTPLFQEGVRRLIRGLGKMRVALLCAEKDPLECHRFVLICHHLRDRLADIQHIVEGRLESNRSVERRLLARFDLRNLELFRKEGEVLEDAYRRQAEKIAYSQADDQDGGLA